MTSVIRDMNGVLLLVMCRIDGCPTRWPAQTTRLYSLIIGPIKQRAILPIHLLGYVVDQSAAIAIR